AGGHAEQAQASRTAGGRLAQRSSGIEIDERPTLRLYRENRALTRALSLRWDSELQSEHGCCPNRLKAKTHGFHKLPVTQIDWRSEGRVARSEHGCEGRAYSRRQPRPSEYLRACHPDASARR